MAGSGPPRALGISSSLNALDAKLAQKDRLFSKRLKKAERDIQINGKRLRRQKEKIDILAGNRTRQTTLGQRKTTLAGSEYIASDEQAVIYGTFKITGSLVIDGILYVLRAPYGT